MRRLMIVIAALVLTAPLAAEQLTVDSVISAYKMGAPEDRILEQIANPANSVTPFGEAELARLRAAGVPEAVTQAMLAKSRATASAVTATGQPDNPSLAVLVKLVKSGLSQDLIIELLQTEGVEQRPSSKDLIYLKENGVPEAIIGALMTAPLKSAPGAPPAKVPDEVVVEGLVLKTGMLASNRPGKMVVTTDKLQWRDGADQTQSFEMFANGIRRFTVTCSRRADAPFCYELEVDFTKGKDFSFEDSKKEVGGNESVVELVDILKQFFPRIPVAEKLKK